MRALPVAWLVGLLALGDARAEPLRLEWKAHASCPDVDAFWSAIASRSQLVRPATTGEPGRHVSVEIVRSAKGSTGRIAIEGSEPRTISGATCSEAIEALAIVTVLVLQPGAQPLAPAEPPAKPSEIEPSHEPAVVEDTLPAPPVEDAPATPEKRGWRWSVGAGADVAASSGVGAVLTTPLSLQVERDVAVRLNLARGESGVVQNGRGPAGQFTWSTARLDVCTPRGRGTFSVSPCVAMEGGSLAGKAVVADRPRDDTHLWLAAHVLGRASIALDSALALELETGAALALTRPEFYVDPDFFLYRPAPFLFHVRGGLVVHFP